MTALSLTVVTLAFPDPNTQPISGEDFQQISDAESYSNQSTSVRTLSTTNTTPGNDLSGLLYTPEVTAIQCPNATQYVPFNSTKAVNLPMDGNFAFIAIAPWISPQCTAAYLTAASRDPIRAFIFFLPDSSSDTPPPANNAVWTVDYPKKWQSAFRFPVYAVPGDFGSQLLQESALYSGNVTNVPNGHLLAGDLPPNAYVRLAGLLDISGESNLPSLWVFLLIVLAILMFIIGSTSCTMHCLQRRRRRVLRRRVANGEVDLERLGIRRLTVPKSILDKMPLYVYPTKESQDSEEADSSNKEIVTAAYREAEIAKPEAKSGTGNTTNANPSQHPNPTLALSQTLCAICLDDFVSDESIVRELPCRHIFHPECVDTFLGENSSLCPLCKKTSLPKGYCPPIITNAMVRRERAHRRLRDRVPPARPAPSGESDQDESSRRFVAMAHIREMGRRVLTITPNRHLRESNQSPVSAMSTTPNPTTTRSTSTQPQTSSEVNTTEPTSTSNPSAPSNSLPGTSRQTSEAEHSNMVRQRAIALLGPDQVANNGPDTDEPPRPAWKSAIGRLWPGLV